MITGTALFIGLFNNLAIFIVLVAVYGALNGFLEKRHHSLRQIVMGLAFGLSAIGCMNVKIPVYQGVIVDQRNAVVILSGAFGGPLSALLSALMAGSYRVYLGGGGVLGGCVGLGLAALCGTALYKMRKKIDTIPKAAAAAAAATVFILPGFLPIDNIVAGWNLLKSMALPYGSAIFLGVFLVGLLLFLEEHRLGAARALLNSERKYRELYESMIDVSFRTDREGRFEIVSPSVETMSGYRPEELIGKHIADLVRTPALGNSLMERLKAEGTLRNIETEILRKDGTSVWISTNAKALRDPGGTFEGTEGISRDITLQKKALEENRQLEESLRQSQKMESIGTLAGGIAHDFNNILAAIIGYAEIARQKLDRNGTIDADIQGIIDAGMRAKELVKHILVFSRKSPHDPQPVDVQFAVRETLKLVRASLPSTIEIRECPVCKDVAIFADPTEIHQIIMNLCTNAAHAMEERGGTLTITIDKTAPTGELIRKNPAMKHGSYAVIQVNDTGTGIPQECLDRIFDPFYTTKEPGKGSGMGLAVVHGIVRRINGTIVVDSAPGRGSTFSVFIPVIEKVAHERTEPASHLPKGTERILLVDDESIIIDVTKRRLELLGYSVTALTGSDEALERFRSNPDAFDLVITDQTMPRMTGDQLSRALLSIRPDIPIVMCTGYNSQIERKRALRMGIRDFIMKPYDQKDLAAIVRNALDSCDKRSAEQEGDPRSP